MKKLLNLWAMLAVLSLTALMAGCGGDDDDDDNGGGAAAPGFAPASANGKSVILIDDAAAIPPQEVHFSVTGNTFTAFVPATQDTLITGTFQYTKTGPDTATLVLSGSDGGVRTINLAFNSQTSGTYSYTTNEGATGTGTFSAFVESQTPPPGDQQPPPDGEQPPPDDQQPPPDNQQPPPDDGAAVAPGSIAGRTVVFNATTGPLPGATTITFGPGNTFTASNSGSGTFTYTASGNSATLILDYTAPPDFVGDRDTFVMTFTSATSGTFTGSTIIDDVESAHSGTFQFQ